MLEFLSIPGNVMALITFAMFLFMYRKTLSLDKSSDQIVIGILLTMTAALYAADAQGFGFLVAIIALVVLLGMISITDASKLRKAEFALAMSQQGLRNV